MSRSMPARAMSLRCSASNICGRYAAWTLYTARTILRLAHLVTILSKAIHVHRVWYHGVQRCHICGLTLSNGTSTGASWLVLGLSSVRGISKQAHACDRRRTSLASSNCARSSCGMHGLAAMRGWCCMLMVAPVLLARTILGGSVPLVACMHNSSESGPLRARTPDHLRSTA